MKLKLLALFFVSAVIASSCNSNPVYNNNYYANIRTEFYSLEPFNWLPVPNESIQWFQEFRLPQSGITNYEYAGVMCYYLNQENAWEALPSTRVFWTDNDVVYSDELWFSHNLEYLYIDYRNTIPGIATPPKDRMRIKAVYFDNNFYRSKAYKDIDWNNYDDVKSQLNLKD
jgi:hypothetical protein